MAESDKPQNVVTDARAHSGSEGGAFGPEKGSSEPEVVVRTTSAVSRPSVSETPRTNVAETSTARRKT